MKKKNEDLILVNKALDNKDMGAFDTLFTRYQKGIKYTILQMVNNNEDAEDLTIEAFSKAFQNLHKYNQQNAFSTWLYRIAVNHSIDFIRKKRLKTISIDESKYAGNDSIKIADNLVVNKPDPLRELLNSEQAEAIEKIIDKLNPNYQELINLRFKEGLSYKAIAERLGVELGTVKGQLGRSKKLFRAIFESSGSKVLF